MDAIQKLQLLGPLTRYEPTEEVNAVGQSAPPPLTAQELAGCIAHATLPNGRRVPILKTLASSFCEMNCRYCAMRAGRDFHREVFIPDELAALTAHLYNQNIIRGVFLSSALMGGGPHTQDRILATGEILRRKYRFAGYVHLKIMPNAEREQIDAAMRWADRVSINLEAPNAKRLQELAPRKEFGDALFQRLRWIDELRRERQETGRAPSASTQFVVGAVGEPDVELLSTAAYLYHELRLARTYFSSFSPVSQTPLEDHEPSSPVREHRLYQASFLLRDYGFDVEELPFAQDGNLPQHEDPKLAWAHLHLSQAPIEVNTADRERLLRIPGIGPLSADRILRARRQGTLRELADLRKLGVPTQRALPFILLDGKQPPRQMTLWPISLPLI
ncbi:MAG: radical SAM protein [Anaerolineae bacterium]|nr:radical SAM protein [Anaerolineae bacterium]